VSSSEGEIPAMRDARDRLESRLREAGMGEREARRRATESAQRVDQRVRDGRVRKPS